VYVVGGYVRDLLLGTEVQDIDITGDGHGSALPGGLRRPGGLPAWWPMTGSALRWCLWRKESWNSWARARSGTTRRRANPEVTPATLEEDLSRREFHRPMPLPCPEMLDGWGSFRIRTAGSRSGGARPPHAAGTGATFEDYPLRMMRAVRFASQLGFPSSPGS